MKTLFAIVYENKMVKNISCGGVAKTRELAQELAKTQDWFYDRYSIVEVPYVANFEEIETAKMEI